MLMMWTFFFRGLLIAYVPSFVGALVIQSRSLTQVPPGVDFNLTCLLDDLTNAAIDVLWTRDGLRISNGTFYQVLGNVLVISNTSVESEGAYQCSDLSRTSRSSVVHVLVQIPPVISVDNVTFNEGQNAKLICRNGRPLDPVLRYAWSRAGTVIQGQFLAGLEIPTASRRDAGTYTCIATNLYGNSSSDGHIKIQYVDIITPSPSVVRLGRNATNAGLSCTAKGDPTPSVVWTTPPNISTTIVDTTMAGTLCSVLLFNTFADDHLAGTYICTAASVAGSEVAVLQVLIVDPPRPPDVVVLKEIAHFSANITWIYSEPRPDSALYAYVIARDVTSGGTGLTKVVPGSVSSVVLESLLPGVHYEVTVVLGNEAGNSTGNPVTGFFTRGLPPSLPPINLAAVNVSTHKVILQWNNPILPPGVSPLTGSVVHYTALSGEVLTHGSVSVSMARVAGLCPGSAYNLSLAVVNHEGNGPFATAEVTTLAAVPQAPVVFARVSSPISIEVQWTADPCNPGSSIRHLIEMWDQSSSIWTAVSPEVIAEFVAVIRNLQLNTTYQVRVFAINGFGSSKPGLSALVTTASLDEPWPGFGVPTSVPRGAVGGSDGVVNVQATATGVVVGIITVVSGVLIIIFVGIVCYKSKHSKGLIFQVEQERCSHATIPEEVLFSVGKEYERELNNIVGMTPILPQFQVTHHHVHFGEDGEGTVVKTVVENSQSSCGPLHPLSEVTEEDSGSICDALVETHYSHLEPLQIVLKGDQSASQLANTSLSCSSQVHVLANAEAAGVGGYGVQPMPHLRVQGLGSSVEVLSTNTEDTILNAAVVYFSGGISGATSHATPTTAHSTCQRDGSARSLPAALQPAAMLRHSSPLTSTASAGCMLSSASRHASRDDLSNSYCAVNKSALDLGRSMESLV